ncbi:MAG TPA: glutamate--tRNA ligase [Polyangiaceae bacterium]|jgi:glutamyl-tRNA synthetase|nr:MAG: Glutamate--tRNA ligase [Deltaproteobacteria bacterium ADurb.Bin207]HNS96517.1 glutamate--tRNA ligase [Polyangiaceae bacterium]HNZ24042.1 glutamate--tRNA ligase [Polyangiaceae bacterium]HOD21833.1 glutamate--tRNA ligase [Polyangiaceae bacterium]HOE49899.1 glutamate--tRNA ligase [Polyangiaceae bacterium]
MANNPAASPRVRFAPSPTGYLHIGGVRTALFNWLWARKMGGSFVLRIEDTDQERSTPESVKVILDSLRWLGLDWDEGPEVGGAHGPYFQMQRLSLYEKYAQELIDKGKAYRCYCTKEELAAARESLRKDNPKAQFRYPGTCRHRKDRPDAPYVVRFNMEAVQREAVTYRDLVFGEITTPNREQQDFVLLRSDGVPLYNFGVVIDDLTMGIDLVMRGRDHMVNTPPQILLYEALGVKPPTFAHLPMMLSPKGEKLSKRHGAVSVSEYEKMGYTPGAVLNYLARFGWSCGDQEIFSLEELVDKFSFESLNRSDGRFDAKKFADVAFEHLKEPRLTSDADYSRHLHPFMAARGLGSVDEAMLRKAIGTVRARGRTLADAAERIEFYFRPVVFDDKAKEKFLTPDVVEPLQAMIACLSSLDSFDEGEIEQAIQQLLASRGWEMKEIAQPARVSLTGQKVSPGVFEMLAVLGREESIRRLRQGVQIARGTAS